MNPAEELNKIAEEIEKVAQGTYVKLMRVDTKDELDAWAQEAGWEGADHMGQELGYPVDDLLGSYYDSTEEIYEVPQEIKELLNQLLSLCTIAFLTRVQKVS